MELCSKLGKKVNISLTASVTVSKTDLTFVPRQFLPSDLNDLWMIKKGVAVYKQLSYKVQGETSTHPLQGTHLQMASLLPILMHKLNTLGNWEAYKICQTVAHMPHLFSIVH